MGPPTTSSEVGRRGRLRRGRERGYNLVALIVILVVINIAVAAVLPMWSTVMRREQEEELLSRGWQYAEAIRVFQARFGRYPMRLEELIEVEPRCIRQLWSDPLSESGGWQVILAGSGQELTGARGPGEEPQGTPGQVVGGRVPGSPSIQSSENQDDEGPTAFDRPRPGALPPGEGPQLGPIEGVRPSATGPSLKSFLGHTDYSEWEFRASMLAGPIVSPDGTPRSPRIGVGSLSRPLPGPAPPTQGVPAGTRLTPDAGSPDED